MTELRELPDCRHFRSGRDPVEFGPTGGQIVGAEDLIDHWKVNGEVRVYRLGLGAVMPVVVGGGCLYPSGSQDL